MLIRLTLLLGRILGTVPFRELGPAPSSALYSCVTLDGHPRFPEPSFFWKGGQ